MNLPLCTWRRDARSKHRVEYLVDGDMDVGGVRHCRAPSSLSCKQEWLTSLKPATWHVYASHPKLTLATGSTTDPNRTFDLAETVSGRNVLSWGQPEFPRRVTVSQRPP